MPKPHVLLATLVCLLGTIPSPCIGTECNETCGNIKIIYPFYLNTSKVDCGLLGYDLVCDNNNTTFLYLGTNQKYEVLDLGPEEITINPLSSQNCTSNNLLSFNLSTNSFKISPQNMLQLYNCNKTCDNCPLLGNYSGNTSFPVSCSNAQRTCCENLGDSSFFNSSKSQMQDFTGGYRSLKNYSTDYKCSSFTSWAYSSINTSLSFSAEYGLMLEWFISGSCACSSNAACTNNSDGYTCKCNSNYTGDGYPNGTGCKSTYTGFLHNPSTQHDKKNNTNQTSPASPAENKKRSSILTTAIVALVVIAAATIIGAAVVAGAVVFRRRKGNLLLRRRMIAGSYRKGDVDGFDALLSGMESFSYKQLDRATKGFASSEKLGNGACGSVYAASLEDGRRVAVKRLHHFNTQIGYQQTVNELSVLSTVKHRNLVRLLGCCMESADPLLVFEYVSNGTLAEHLQRERGEALDWFTRLTIAAETADALAYLHTMDPPILHRDVKSRNILLDHDFNTKVADFGLSRMGLSPSADISHISTIPQGTPGYLDPDYHQNFHLSDKSDVYSFGVVLIEIISALKPVDFSREKKEVNLAALAVAKIGGGSLDDIIDRSLEAHRKSNVRAMVQRVAELAFRCLAYDKDARPSMTEVLEELLLIRGSAMSPLTDITEDDSVCSSWIDAQGTSHHDSGSSLSSSEADRFLLSKPEPLSPAGVVQASWEIKDSSSQDV